MPSRNIHPKKNTHLKRTMLAAICTYSLLGVTNQALADTTQTKQIPLHFIVAATDKFMSSDFVKNNFKGSLHLNVYIAAGKGEETHSYAILQPSLAEHEIWLAKVSDPNNEEVRKFGSVLNANSEGVGTRINTFIKTYWSGLYS